MSHPDSQSDQISGSEQSPGSETIYWDSLTVFFLLRDELVPAGIQTISVITKIIYIYKRTTTGVVSIKIYTHILSPMYLYIYISNTKHHRSRKQRWRAPISEMARATSVECPVLLPPPLNSNTYHLIYFLPYGSYYMHLLFSYVFY